MKISKEELIELFKAGRPLEDLNTFVKLVEAIPEEPTEQPTENDPLKQNPEDAEKIKQLEEQIATLTASSEKLQADLTAAQQANVRGAADSEPEDPLEAVKEIFRRG